MGESDNEPELNSSYERDWWVPSDEKVTVTWGDWWCEFQNGFSSVQFNSSACLTLCDLMNCSTPGFPVHHQFPESTQTHVHRIGDDIQPSHPLSPPCPPAFSPSQHQGLFQWVGCSQQVVKVLEFQLQHQSFQWTFRTNFLQDGLVGFPCSLRDSLRVFSNTAFQKHQFLGSQLSL